MAMMVTRTYVVDTEDVDEAYQLTKGSGKVGDYAIGQIRPFDPNATPGAQAPVTAPVASLGMGKLATAPKTGKPPK